MTNIVNTNRGYKNNNLTIDGDVTIENNEIVTKQVHKEYQKIRDYMSGGDLMSNSQFP